MQTTLYFLPLFLFVGSARTCFLISLRKVLPQLGQVKITFTILNNLQSRVNRPSIYRIEKIDRTSRRRINSDTDKLHVLLSSSIKSFYKVTSDTDRQWCG